MATLKEAKAKVQELAQKALAIAESKSLTYAQMKLALTGPDGKSGLEADIKHWENEVTSLSFVEANRGNSPWMAELSGIQTNGSMKAFGLAPSLKVGTDDARAMFEAIKRSGSYQIETKDLSSDAGSAAVDLLNPDMRPGLVPLKREPVRILEHLSGIATGSDAVSWLTHASTTGSANTVAAGNLKPEAFPNITKQLLVMRKIAVYAVQNEETLEDFTGFSQFLNAELMRLVVATENAQLISGDGVGENILGMLNASGILVRAKGSDSYLDCLEQGVQDIRVGASFTEPDGVLMHPSTWSLVRRSKTSTGEYLLNQNPSSAETNTLWGLPVLPTTSMPVGTALMGNFTEAVTPIVRSGLSIRMSNSSGDGFQRNQYAFVAEERLQLGINYPASLLKITGLV